MDIEPGRLGALVTGKQRDIVQIYAGSFEDRAPLVAQGVGCESGQTYPLPHPFHDFVKGTDGERTAWIAGGLGEENRPESSASYADTSVRRSPSMY